MTEHEFADLLGSIDPALVARAEAPVPPKSKPGFRIALVSVAAALLVLFTLLGAAAIAFFPKTYDLDYEIPKHQPASRPVQIYYTENGRIKRQSVLLPPSAENIFMTWQHLNGLEDEAALIEIASTEGAYSDRQVVMTLSTALQDHPESEALLRSLQKTFAQFFVMRAENLSFAFAAEKVVLQFSHDLERVPTPVRKGNTLEITVTMTNVSDQDVVHVGSLGDFVPAAKLCMSDITVLPIPYATTDEVVEYRLAPGQSKSVTYTFEIPYALPMAGYFNLVMSFGEYSQTEPQAVLLGFSDPNNRQALKAFSDFSRAYVPETNPDFSQALAGYTYQGKSIMTDMQIVNGDGENYWTESGHCPNFSYSASSQYCDWVTVDNRYFSADKLPDNWELPMGITVQDSVYDVLLKMGFEAEIADKFLQENGTVRLAGFDMYSSTINFDGTLYLHCNDDTYVIEHTNSNTPVYQDDLRQQADMTVQITYNRKTQSFESISIALQFTTKESIVLKQPVVLVEIAGQAQKLTLTQEQVEFLQTAMFNGIWNSPYLPDEILYDCKGKIGDKEVLCSSKQGILQYDGFYINLTGQDWEDFIEMLGIDYP